MKLLIISDAWQPQVNGVVRTYEYLRDELQTRGHEVKIIGPADMPRTMPLPGYSEISLAILPYKTLKSMIEAFAPDAIHIATEGPLGSAARKYCLKHNQSFTTSYHTHFPDYVAKRIAKYLTFLYKPVHTLAKRYIRNFHAPSTCILIATQSLEDELRSWGFTAPMHRFTRGVKLEQFHPGEKTAYTGNKAPIALYVGRVAIEKNIEAFLDMDWAGTKVIVGDGPSLQDLKNKYPESLFVGSQTGADLAAYYRSADIFVFPSKTDTFGIVILEALASGLPIAAYNVTGPKDIITEDFLGTLTDDDLSAAAKDALNKPSAQKRAEYVTQYYTWDNAATQFENAALKAAQS